MKNMELVESPSVLKNIYYRYIHEPFLKIKERWLAYFAGFSMDDEPSAADVETEIQSFEVLPSKKERKKIVKQKTEDGSQLNLGRFAFFSTALGATLGFGHIWRFPNLAYKYGGGAFLIIYVVSTLLLGYALHFMEVAVGQYSSKGTLKVFERVPIMQGVAYSILIYGYVLSTYYSQVVAYGIHYFISSFHFVLPWTYCPESGIEFKEAFCYIPEDPGNPLIAKLQCPSGPLTINFDDLCFNTTYRAEMRKACCPEDPGCKEFNVDRLCTGRMDPATYHWIYYMYYYLEQNGTTNTTFGNDKALLEVNPYWEKLSSINLDLLLCTFAAWFVVYVLMSAGIKWTGVISMTILPFLFIGLVLMVLVSISNEGSIDGIAYFFVPNLQDFYKNEIWYAALSHAFFSLGIASGLGFTLGSISKFRNPCHIDTFSVTVIVILMSILSGTVVFSMVGYTAKNYGLQFDRLELHCTCTSFIAYSDILSKFPVSWLSSAAFFFLFSIAVAISVSCVLISTSRSISEVSKVFYKDRYVINFLIVFSCFVFNIPLTMDHGILLFSVLDNFTIRLVLPIICFFEIVALFMYGINLFLEDVSFMIGSYPSRFFKYSWALCPLAIIAAWIYKFLDLEFNDWTLWVKIFEIAISSIIVVPIVFFIFVNALKYLFQGKPKKMFRSPAKCHPLSEELRVLRMDFRVRRTIF